MTPPLDSATLLDARTALDSVNLPGDVRAALDACRSIVIPASREELYRLAL